MKTLRELFWWGIAAIIALIALAAVGSHYAKAQDICMPHETVRALLKKDYGETLAARAIDRDGRLIEIYNSRAGTWTITVTEPGKDTCFWRGGDSWQGELRYQNVDHHYAPPHSWISEHTNGNIGCCGPGDIAEIPHWEAAGAVVGSSVTADFPGYGEKTVTVKKVYPTQDDKAYITRFGCLFKSFGI